MLKTALTHPQILGALAGAGHGSLVLIADGNYPASTKRGAAATLVYLNLAPGVVDATTILAQVLTAVPVEEAFVMQPMSEGPFAMADDPGIWAEFRSALDTAGVSCELKPVERMGFYALASGPDVALTIVSGESRIYGNLVLRIGVVQA